MTDFLDFLDPIFEFIGNFIELADVVDWVRDLVWGQPTISTTTKGDLPAPKNNGREIVARKSTTTILTRRPLR